MPTLLEQAAKLRATLGLRTLDTIHVATIVVFVEQCLAHVSQEETAGTHPSHYRRPSHAPS